jgi:hypothetical protein
MHTSTRSSLALTAIIAVTGLFGASSTARAGEPSVTTARDAQAERIAPWRARFGRSRPVVEAESGQEWFCHSIKKTLCPFFPVSGQVGRRRRFEP